MQGSGLGRVLLLAGLRHLVDGGAEEVLLYVESDNPAAHLYERTGFAHAPADTHVQYVRP
jgi:mycothiol synthase